MTVVARFIDGPMDGERVVMPRTLTRYSVPVLPSGSINELHYNSTHHAPVRYRVAVYELWDNWPVRYKFSHYEEHA